LPWAFARSHYTPHNVAVGNHANWFQVLLRFDHSKLAAIALSFPEKEIRGKTK